MPIKKIAILGAGNGGCAAAADLTLRGFQVRFFSRSESTVSRLAKLGEIELVEDGVAQKAAPFFISSQLPPVIQGVDLIVMETFSDLYEIREAIKAAKEVRRLRESPLPIVASVTFTRDDRTLLGDEPMKVARTLRDAGAEARSAPRDQRDLVIESHGSSFDCNDTLKGVCSLSSST